MEDSPRRASGRRAAGAEQVAWFAWAAWAAGVGGLLANLLLIAFYALLALHSRSADWVGPASDLVGSLATAPMIAVALGLGLLLPARLSARLGQAIGIAATVLLTVAGPLLVFGVLPFEIETPISMAAFFLLAAWVVLVSRQLRDSPAYSPGVFRLGQLAGGAVLLGAGVVGLGLLLPWVSWPQLIVFGVGGLPGVLGWLAIPIWFLLLAQTLSSSPKAAAKAEPQPQPAAST